MDFIQQLKDRRNMETARSQISELESQRDNVIAEIQKRIAGEQSSSSVQWSPLLV